MKKLLCLFSLLIGMQCLALDSSPYSEKAFNTAQKAGIPVLIDVYAAWCPTCERQQYILNRYFNDNPKSPIKVLIIDYDKDKKWVSHYKAPRQSTLLIYKNNQQLWFSVASTSRKVIETALNNAVAQP